MIQFDVLINDSTEPHVTKVIDFNLLSDTHATYNICEGTVDVIQYSFRLLLVI